MKSDFIPEHTHASKKARSVVIVEGETMTITNAKVTVKSTRVWPSPLPQKHMIIVVCQSDRIDQKSNEEFSLL